MAVVWDGGGITGSGGMWGGDLGVLSRMIVGYLGVVGCGVEIWGYCLGWWKDT
jgi:hypothetical protein